MDIKKIIREELNKTEQNTYNVCSEFTGDGNTLCNGLNNLRYLLLNKKDLNLQDVIDKKLDKFKTNVPESDKQKFIKGLKLLYKTGKYDRNYIIKIKDDIDNARLIYVNGEWHHVNKLNTNYSDLAELLTHYIIEKKPQELQPLLDLLSTGDNNSVIKYLKTITTGFQDSFKLEDIMTFIRNTTVNTGIGEECEDMVVDFLLSKGLTIDYQGGNGDFIDMKFGVDIIADMKLIQVKASLKSVTKIRPEIDWIAVANKYQGVGIFDRSGNPVTYNGQLLSNSKLDLKMVKDVILKLE